MDRTSRRNRHESSRKALTGEINWRLSDTFLKNNFARLQQWIEGVNGFHPNMQHGRVGLNSLRNTMASMWKAYIGYYLFGNPHEDYVMMNAGVGNTITGLRSLIPLDSGYRTQNLNTAI